MTIGGLTVGVTPLDMAHAYETIAHGGQRVSGTLAPSRRTGRRSRKSTPAATRCPTARTTTSTASRPRRVLPAERRRRPRPRCSRPCSSTAPAAPPRSASSPPARPARPRTTATPGSSAGTRKYTVAVWVGYPDKLVPMTTTFNGGPVLGGTFPALIWHDFMTSALQIDKARAERRRGGQAPARRTGDGGEHRAAPEAARSTRLERTASAGAPAAARAALEQAAPSTADASDTRGAAATAARAAQRPQRRAHEAPAAPAATTNRPRRRANPPRRPRRPSSPDRRRQRPAASGRAALSQGHGRETLRSPPTQKRHGSSTARVMPIRVPCDDRRLEPLARRAPIATGAVAQGAAVLVQLDRRAPA